MEHYNPASNSTTVKENSVAGEPAKKKRPSRKKSDNKTSKAPIDVEDVEIICNLSMLRWTLTLFSLPHSLNSSGADEKRGC